MVLGTSWIFGWFTNSIAKPDYLNCYIRICWEEAVFDISKCRKLYYLDFVASGVWV